MDTPDESKTIPTVEEWKSKGRFLNILGNQIFVLDNKSDKDTLVILHGFPTSSYDYWKVLPQLSQHFRIVIHDHLGFGLSDKPADYSYSFIEQCDVACAVWNELKIDAAHILAHDYGTSIATELLARKQRGYPTLDIKSLTFCNGSIHIELSKLRFIQKLLRSNLLGNLVAKLTTQRTFDRNMKNIWYDKSLLDQTELNNMWELLEMHSGKLVLPKISKYTYERFKFWHRWVGALEKTDLPTNILWAQNDPVAVELIAHTLHKEIKNSKLKLLPNLGHYPMLEQPEIWADAFLEMIFSKNTI